MYRLLRNNSSLLLQYFLKTEHFIVHNYTIQLFRFYQKKIYIYIKIYFIKLHYN